MSLDGLVDDGVSAWACSIISERILWLPYSRASPVSIVESGWERRCGCGGGGRALLERIRHRFGPRVAMIVEGCSDNVDGDLAESWIERKRRYLQHLPRVTDDGVSRVALADKVHNARSIVRDYREDGQRLTERFTQKTAREQLWYYGGLAAFFEAWRPGPLTEDLRRAVSELAWLAARDDAQRMTRRRVWLDPDPHGGQAPAGWIQALTAVEAIGLLDEFVVHELSRPPGSARCATAIR